MGHGRGRQLDRSREAHVRKVVQRRIRHEGDGVNVAADVNAVVSTNSGGRGAKTTTSRRQRLRVVQRGGRAEVSERTGE